MRYLLVFVSIVATVVEAQQPAPQQLPVASPSPKTRLEQFQAKTGSVVVKGYSEVGRLPGKSGSAVTVTSMEVTDASNSAKQFGIIITTQGAGQYAQENTSYIDFDEVDSLLKGIDYIGRVDKSVTKLGRFEATYRTKGDFAVATFGGQRTETMLALGSASFGTAKAYFDVAELPKLRQLVQKAQATLEAIK